MFKHSFEFLSHYSSLLKTQTFPRATDWRSPMPNPRNLASVNGSKFEMHMPSSTKANVLVTCPVIICDDCYSYWLASAGRGRSSGANTDKILQQHCTISDCPCQGQVLGSYQRVCLSDVRKHQNGQYASWPKKTSCCNRPWGKETV